MTSDTIFKIITSILISGLILVTSFCFYFMYKQNEVNNKNLAEIQIKQKQIDESITRSSTSFDDVKKVINDSKIDLSNVEKDLNNLNAKIDSVNKVQVVTVYQKEKDQKTESTKPKDPKEEIQVKSEELKLETQFIQLKEKSNEKYIPIGNVGFSYWRKDPWQYEIYERKYKVTNIIAKDESNKTIVYNKFSINANNQDYDLQIISAKNIQVFPENKFHFYPKLYLSSGLGYKFDNTLNGSINLIGNFIQYGQYKNNPKIAFLGIGLGKSFTDKYVKFTIMPLMYNLNNFTNLIQNTYIAPSYSIDSNKTSDISLNLLLSF